MFLPLSSLAVVKKGLSGISLPSLEDSRRGAVAHATRADRTGDAEVAYASDLQKATITVFSFSPDFV